MTYLCFHWFCALADEVDPAVEKRSTGEDGKQADNRCDHLNASGAGSTLALPPQAADQLEEADEEDRDQGERDDSQKDVEDVDHPLRSWEVQHGPYIWRLLGDQCENCKHHLS